METIFGFLGIADSSRFSQVSQQLRHLYQR